MDNQGMVKQLLLNESLLRKNVCSSSLQQLWISLLTWINPSFFFSKRTVWELTLWYIKPFSQSKTGKPDFWDCNNSIKFKHH